MRVFHSILFLFLGVIALAQAPLEDRLFDLADVRFFAIEAPKDSPFQSYQLMVRQPVDHKDPSKGHFYQKVYLNHVGYDRPTVIATEGYAAPRNRLYEPTFLLQANQVTVEHRYFGESIPQPMDWQYLTLEQATADLHHIRTLLGELYGGKWLSTGISKGGQTTIAYRYFYPDDVAVSVPYVAPLNNAFEDKRIYEFLDEVGNADCRAAIEDFQIRLLKNRDDILPLLKWYAKGGKMEFNYHSVEEAFEFAVLEYSFSFWQWGSDCASIPDKDKPLDEALQHFIDVVGIAFYNDEQVKAYEAHYYQASTQIGYYGFKTKKFKKWLKALPKKPHASFEPDKMETRYDPSYNKKVAEWLNKHGDRFVYIYGELDTWSATRVPESDKVDALWFIMPDHSHGDARIQNLSPENQRKIVQKLKEWMGE